MGESQSRYGIMEELNSKKLAAKKELADLERNKEENIVTFNEKIDIVEKNLQQKAATYKEDHERWKKNKELNLNIEIKRYDRYVEGIREEIQEEDNTYEEKYLDWKEREEKDLEDSKKDLKVYEKIKTADVEAKKEIITEIEEGIKSLKEMSKEQATKE